ncbi:hypothetical protein JSO19_00285 [Leucobacter sp. UCMA 4100]|uniref:hypothetical protein n=1 Tax=Leucobacter sp. UCMA 4100 TaxID=2810534 RepID=UPI0022EAF00B|nr:hypothetical protein [Leucobacter sp. UCMA 4100]MDA3145816.1 hypothetical protein [Leucobacter sp. UCMA 4100]
MPVAARRHFVTMKTCALYVATGLAIGLGITGVVWFTEPSGFIVWVAFMLSGIGAISLGLGWVCGAVIAWAATKLAMNLQLVLVALTSIVVSAATAFALLSAIPSSHTAALVAAFGVAAAVVAAVTTVQAARAE